MPLKQYLLHGSWFACLLISGHTALSQGTIAQTNESSAPVIANYESPLSTAAANRDSLPEAPSPALSDSAAAGPAGTGATAQSNGHSVVSPAPPTQYPFTVRYSKYINPGEPAPPLAPKDKLVLSMFEQVQPWALISPVIAGAWSHMLDSPPKYGTDSGAFAERVGAAALRQASQAIFSDGIGATVFHQDPRFYVRRTGSVWSRGWYAASRVFVRQSDDGRMEPNYSQLSGYAGAAILTKTYYPAVSCTWGKVWEGYAVSLSGAALGNGLHEFAPEAMRLIHGAYKKTKLPNPTGN